MESNLQKPKDIDIKKDKGRRSTIFQKLPRLNTKNTNKLSINNIIIYNHCFILIHILIYYFQNDFCIIPKITYMNPLINPTTNNTENINIISSNCSTLLLVFVELIIIDDIVSVI